MKEKFEIKMTKDEMLKYYANKIVEKGLQECSEFNYIVNLQDFNKDNFQLEKYKDELLQMLYKDERLADVFIDKDLDVNMVFYLDYCPFYFEDEEDLQYSKITDSPTYQGVILKEFSNYIDSIVNENGCMSTRNLINNFVQTKDINENDKSKLINLLKKNIVEIGFADKYAEDNMEIYVTYKNCDELENGLDKVIKAKDEEALKLFNESEEEFE